MTDEPTDLLPLQQSPRYAAALELMGRRVTMLPAPSGPPILAMRRRFGPASVCYLPRADLSGGRARALRGLPRHALRIVIPEAETRLRRGWPVLTAQHVAELHLPDQPVLDTLWQNMDGNWRNRLRRALDGPLYIRQSAFDPERHDHLTSRELRQQRRRGYRGLPTAFLSAYVEANPHHTSLFEARLNGATVAFMLFLSHGPVATYAVGWTGPEGREHHAHNLLMWEATKTLFSKGILRLDLGTVDEEDGAGLSRFKLGTGAIARPLGRTLVVPPGFRVSP